MNNSLMAAIIFIVTYAGVALGTLPGLAIDRTGIALLGAIAVVVSGILPAMDAVHAIDLSTILLLYGLMIVSAQLRLGGFYSRIALRIVDIRKSPQRLLLILMVVSGLLSALLANDIICLAFTPIICVSLTRRNLNPVPFLLGLAAASNIGSAATIIGNPQNMLIGQMGGLQFSTFLLWCTPPSLAALAGAYGFIIMLYRGRWQQEPAIDRIEEDWPAYNRHQSIKGLIITAFVVALFFTKIPREVTAIAAAGFLLCSRKITTRSILGLVDWHLITLFCALFIVIGAISRYAIPGEIIEFMASFGIDINEPLSLGTAAFVLSTLVSNVPAVMLILKNMDLSSMSNLYLLALVSTFAGNLITISSIANLITIEQAKRYGIHISFTEHLRTGIPVTLVSLAITLIWTYLIG